MRALSSVNLRGNKIPGEQAHELVKIMQAKENLTTLCGLSREETELDFSGQYLGPGDAVLIANDINDMGALLVLSLEGNGLHAEGGKALATGLKGNQVITELNVSNNNLGYNSSYDADASGITAIADAIPDMGAISSVNVLFNGIGTDQAHTLANVLKEHATLKSLCGNTGNETELDVSGKKIGADGAIMLAPEIAGNGATTSLDVSENDLGALVLPGGWQCDKSASSWNSSKWIYKHADGREQKGNPGKPDGIIALANAITDMGALTKFDISENNIRAEGGKVLAEALKGNQVMTELSIARNMLIFKADAQSKADTDMSGVATLADVISDMRAMSKLTFGDKQVVTMTTDMTEANFSGKLKSYEALIVAAFLPKCT
jgi:hypothetical protein